MLNGAVVRTNRLTGRTSVLWGGNWVTMQAPGPAQPPKPSLELPQDELGKMTGNASIRGGYFSGKIYNGSNWWIERVYLVATAKERNGKVRWTREMTASLRADPLETKFFSVPVTGDEDIGSTDWNIERAVGYKSDSLPASQHKFRNARDGLIRFPASMSDEEIDEAMKKLYPLKTRNKPNNQ